MATDPPGAVGSTSPDEQVAGGSIDIDRRFVKVTVGPRQSGRAAGDEDPQISAAAAAQPDAEVGIRMGIVSAAGHEKDLPELTDRVVDQFILAKETVADVIVAGDVPPVQRVFVAQMRDELRYRHPATRPGNDRLPIPGEDVGHQFAHPDLLGVEPIQ